MSGRSRLQVVTAGVLALAVALGGPAVMSFADETEPTTTPTSTEVEPTTTTEPTPTGTTEPPPIQPPAEPTPLVPDEPVTIEPVPTPTGPWGGPAPVEVPPPSGT